jgi:hypothetical protein
MEIERGIMVCCLASNRDESFSGDHTCSESRIHTCDEKELQTNRLAPIPFTSYQSRNGCCLQILKSII